MIKAIFFDIDGTLVSFRTHQIADSTLQALDELRKKGIKIFIATGRPKMLMADAVGHIPFDGYITLNGAHCFTSDAQTIYRNGIPHSDICRLIEYLDHRNTPFVFADEQEWFITGVDHRVEEVSRLIEIPYPPVREAREAKEKTILQLMGYIGKEQEDELFDKVLIHCEPLRWHPMFADIIAKGNSKSNGIDHMLAHYGIDLTETMAFGDGGNDIDMLKHVAWGVAMGNAGDEVKAAAGYVTSSVDEDGIRNALLHLGVL